MLGALFLGLLGQASLGQAREPAGERASFLFSNGGRILEAKADGTGRKVIFGRHVNPENGQLGAIEPAASPDGMSVAFGLRGKAELTQIWVTSRDGGGPKRLLKSTDRIRFGDPTYSPTGELVVTYFREDRRRAVTGLLQISNSGSIEKRILIKRQTWKPVRFDWTEFREPKFSPDGSRILFARSSESWSELFEDANATDLMILDLDSGRVRKVAEQALGGDWSPDGKRIVYTAATWDEALELCWPFGTACTDGGHLEIIGADGKGSRKLVRMAGDQRSADWSEDGRIVFQSASNVPNTGDATEIYSVLPSGKCLTQLTNGSPASTDPAWVSSDESSEPSSCGAKAPGPVIDMKRPKGRISLWLGMSSGQMLLSGQEWEASIPFLSYADCVNQKPSHCARPFLVYSVGLCSVEGQLAALALSKPARYQRGVPVFRFRGREIGPLAYVFTGRGYALFMRGANGGPYSWKKEIDALRPFPQDEVKGDLAAPLFPASDIRRMKRVLRVFKVTGSVVTTAKRLDLKPAVVRRNLRLPKALKKFGDYGTMECPRRSSSDR